MISSRHHTHYNTLPTYSSHYYLYPIYIYTLEIRMSLLLLSLTRFLTSVVLCLCYFVLLIRAHGVFTYLGISSVWSILMQWYLLVILVKAWSSHYIRL